MIGREKANATSLQKIYLLTADQLSRLLGKERDRVEALQRESSDALGRAEREVRQHGDSSRAYALFRGTQQRHLAEASRERETPLMVKELSIRQNNGGKNELPSPGIEPVDLGAHSDEPLVRSPDPASVSNEVEKKKIISPVGIEPGPLEGVVKRRKVRVVGNSASVPKPKAPWLLRSKTKTSRVA